MKSPGVPGHENEIDRAAGGADSRDLERRTIVVANQQEELPGRHVAFDRQIETGRNRLALHRNAINHTPSKNFFANGVFRNLGHRGGYATGEQRVSGFQFQPGEFEVSCAEVQGKAGFAGGFGPVTDGDRSGRDGSGFDAGGLDDSAGNGDCFGTLVINGDAQPFPRNGFYGNAHLADTVWLAEDGLAFGKCLPLFAVGGAFDEYSFDEAGGGAFQGDAVYGLSRTGFEGDNRAGAIEGDCEGFCGAGTSGGDSRAREETRDFEAGIIVKSEVFEIWTGFVQRLDGQANGSQSGGRDLEFLFVLPIRRQCGGSGRD